MMCPRYLLEAGGTQAISLILLPIYLKLAALTTPAIIARSSLLMRAGGTARSLSASAVNK
eukprot:5313298-Pleurochrysis_carterae.AAC.1